jgi:hypothetical protein
MQALRNMWFRCQKYYRVGSETFHGAMAWPKNGKHPNYRGEGKPLLETAALL